MFALLALPLSLLFFSRALAFHPIQSQILHLEFVASLSPTRFEARHVWKESREIAIALLHSNFLYSVPSFTLSLLAAVSSVVSAESGYHRNPISGKSRASYAMVFNWRRDFRFGFCYLGYRVGPGDLFDGGFGDGFGGFDFGGEGGKMEGLKMDGEDSAKETRWKAVMLLKGWETMGLAVVYGAVMVWGYVVTTVFYCECRKQHVVWEVECGSVEA
ncbi:hypothetical protein OIU85_012477 [Salix viminalis]|uniref:Uncharacterized protein n=1 Tax=Salix viminalis TaxID=40686 RepID=A0A9Q0NPD8_SALVM|nr:hypothetical protein OIU85_012477 [Salix viminalis]